MLKGIREFIFTQNNTKKGKPNEDCWGKSPSGAYVVADGATRPRNEKGEYPELSARLAAEAFCATALLALQNDNSILWAFSYGNDAIKEVNRENGITLDTADHLQHDFLACVGVVGMLTGKFPYELHCGYIGDCGVLVYDKDLLPVFLSENQLAALEQFRDQWGFGDNADEQRLFWCTHIRNQHPSRHMTYGSLTGEREAIVYVRNGFVKLEPGDTVLLFSDGILPFIYDRWFRRILRHDFREKLGNKFIDIFENNLVRLAQELRAGGVKNLDDDKTLIAISILDSPDA